ncbi:hypothetical protein GCM10010282_49500 [Streptomyces roseolus]|nr:hypothetical protein GCM10010282_49500 [Streptomyces roseolus]
MGPLAYERIVGGHGSGHGEASGRYTDHGHTGTSMWPPVSDRTAALSVRGREAGKPVSLTPDRGAGRIGFP